jgi:hypothetical protein
LAKKAVFSNTKRLTKFEQNAQVGQFQKSSLFLGKPKKVN